MQVGCVTNRHGPSLLSWGSLHPIPPVCPMIVYDVVPRTCACICLHIVMILTTLTAMMIYVSDVAWPIPLDDDPGYRLHSRYTRDD